MPIYVYKNLSTGERFEIEQRITEPPLEEHPESGDPVKRLVQPVGIAFKGSGFYATDSRSATRSNQPASASETSGKEAGAKESGGKESSGGSAASDSPTKAATKDTSTGSSSSSSS